MAHKLGRASNVVVLILVFLGGGLAGSAVVLQLVGVDEPAEAPTDPAAERPENLRRLEQLRSLPYVSGVAPVSESDRGVVVHDRGRSWAGVNFFNCSDRAGAFMIDMDGGKIFEWAAPDPSEDWKHAELLPSGDVLVVVGDQRVMRVSLTGVVRWEYRVPAHHDLWVTDDDRIYLLARRLVRTDVIHPTVPAFIDEIHVLDDSGRLLGVLSIFEAVLRSPYAFLLPSSHDLSTEPSSAGLVLDVLHANHVQVFDGSLEERSPLFRRGNILVSMRTISAIGILDPAEGRFVWMWGPNNLSLQHHPTLLANGHILIFDNGRSASQIVEFDPLTDTVVWRYAPVEGFFSETRGSVQRLANGNTLITESDPGVAFEITADGETVWRYNNPLVTPERLREPIWRMTRYDPAELEFLEP